MRRDIHFECRQYESSYPYNGGTTAMECYYRVNITCKDDFCAFKMKISELDEQGSPEYMPKSSFEEVYH
jgi:hypothetical protein